MPEKKKPKKAEKVPVSFRLPQPVLDALDEFLASFEEFPPDRSQVFERAIRQYLREKGHAPADEES